MNIARQLKTHLGRWPEVLLIGGVTGIGKTTLANEVAHSVRPHEPIIASPDAYWSKDRPYDPAWLPEAHGQAFRKSLSAIAGIANVKDRPALIVHDLFAKAEDVAPYAALAESLGADWRLAYLTRNDYGCKAISFEALAERSRHHIPAMTIRKQEERLERTLSRENDRFPRRWQHNVTIIQTNRDGTAADSISILLAWPTWLGDLPE